MSKIDSKISVLSKIRDSKDILFGKFSNILTKEKKVEEWNKICEYCKALGLIPQDKNYSYVRDVFWSNIKRATLAKRDNANQTGSAGGKIIKYTPIDDIVIDIIGPDSPISEGIRVKNIKTENSTIAEISNSQNTKSSSSQVDTSHKIPKRIMTKNSTSYAKYNEEINLKKRKLELQHLALKNYKLKLEIFEMERRLNIPNSEFTRELFIE